MVVLVLVKRVILGGVNGQFGSVSGPCGSSHESFWVGSVLILGEPMVSVSAVVILGRSAVILGRSAVILGRVGCHSGSGQSVFRQKNRYLNLI